MSLSAERHEVKISYKGALTSSANQPTNTSGLLSDTRLIRNAICTDWPGYFLSNKNSVVKNKVGQMSKVKDAIKNVSFAP